MSTYHLLNFDTHWYLKLIIAVALLNSSCIKTLNYVKGLLFMCRKNILAQ